MPETLLRLHFLSLLLLSSCAFLSSSSTIDVDDVVVGLVACLPRQIEAFTQFTNEFDTRSCNHSDYSNNGAWCDNSTGAVTKIHLTGCLSGTLKPNSSLFGFQQLRHLVLSNNNFISSTLPSKFGNLNRLEVLILSSNGLLGEVPSSISNLSQLSILKLSKNKLIGSFPLISNLTKLSVLSLSQNLFTGTIPSSIFTMPSLFYLNVNDNHLTGPHEVPDSSTSSSLEFLNLGKNQFEGKILEPISKLINLKRLDLSFLNISYPIDLRLLSSLKSLLDLYLSGNSLLATSLSADSDIPPNLETLVMSYCDLNEFPNVLKTLNNLRGLSISSNRIKGKVPEWLWTLPSLSTVLLGNNYFNGFQGTRKVLVDSSVQMLDIQSNHFEGEIPLPPLSLNAFYARNNTFTGNIPLSFCNRTSLTVLDLSYNNFTGPILQCLNDFKIVKLRKNNLEGNLPDRNQLSGTIPSGLKSLSFLAHINVSHNQLKGEIPQGTQITGQSKSSFEGNAGLCGLPLEESWFAPPTQQPKEEEEEEEKEEEEVLNWRGVAIGFGPGVLLGLAITQVIASYKPEWLIKIMCQHIPDMLYNGSLLRTLDVGYNQLTGKLPRSLLNCSSLRFVSVDNNKIKDTFPFWLKALPGLQVLTLRSNKFYGPVSLPGEVPLAFPKLHILEISDNNFTGSLPSNYFVNWKASSLETNDDGRIYMGDYNNAYYIYEDTMDLQYKGLFMEQGKVLTSYATIDFSGNRFEGQIPESIGLLKALIALNLSNNGFTGHIPLSMENVTELESLDLSGNKLSGTIPKGLARLSFLAYISVAHNQLIGEIPQGPQFSGQAETSFEGNAGLCGLPLQGSCFAPPPTQQFEEEDEEEGVFKLESGGYRVWTWLVIWIAHVIASYMPKWFVKIVGPDKHKEADPASLFDSLDSRWDSSSNHIFTLVVGLSGCHPDQIHALNQFKNEFDSRNCNQTDYLNGVQCDNATGAVTELQLPSGCLTGVLKPNSSLFHLRHLRHLNLSHNNFTSSSLPSEFSNLSRLEVLSLSSNSFIG
ncbi:LOW QUALITY PROTEIN: hypothetical protein HID58_059312, partial [Brassica napus]